MNNTIKRFNIVVLVTLITALLFYIFLSNYVLSQKYRLEVLKHRLDQAHALADTVGDPNTTGDSITELTAFAQKSGMVEAKDVYSLFEDSGVALSRLGN